MSYTELPSPNHGSPARPSGVQLPPINSTVRTYLNSPIDSPAVARSPRGVNKGLDMSLMQSSPDIHRITAEPKTQSQSVRGRPHNISFDSSISKHPPQ